MGRRQIRNTCNQSLWLCAVKAGLWRSESGVITHHEHLAACWKTQPHITKQMPRKMTQPLNRSFFQRYCATPLHGTGVHDTVSTPCAPRGGQDFINCRKIDVRLEVCFRGRLSGCRHHPTCHHAFAAAVVVVCPRIDATSRIHIACF